MALENLNKVWGAASQDIYNASQQGWRQPYRRTYCRKQPTEETVSDVEYEEVKDEK
jgi:hypothetical protein